MSNSRRKMVEKLQKLITERRVYMRKSIIVVLSIICIIVILCSCTQKANDDSYETISLNVTTGEWSVEHAEPTTTANTVETTAAYVEPRGVPDSVILRNAYVPENTTYEIEHNYDSDAHIDDVLLTMYYNANFGTEITTCSYAYQYDRSSDLWELIDERKEQNDRSVSFDEEAYQNNSPFIGNTNEYHNCEYSISVLDIDIENMKAKIEYSVDFSSSSVPDLSNSATVELWCSNDGEGPYFVIPYSRSIVVRDEILFMLSIDEGIQFVQ